MPEISENITAIVPVSGRPDLLKEALRSILSGSLIPVEIIVVVDSNDPLDKSDESAAESIFLDSPSRNVCHRILRTNGIGPAGARNAGIRSSHGEWIALLDSDDLWTEKKLEKQMAFLSRRPHLSGCQTIERWVKNNRVLHQPAHLRPRGGFFLKESFRTCLISPSSVILRRNVFNTIGFFDETYPVCEDFEFWLRYLSRYCMGLVVEELTVKRSGEWPQLSRSRHSLDELRIAAILKTVRSAPLSDETILDAFRACVEKLEILETGARKRNSEERVRPLREEIRNTFSEIFLNRFPENGQRELARLFTYPRLRRRSGHLPPIFHIF